MPPRALACGGMPYFFYRLNPPRPTFPGDMTDAERDIMGEHAQYWRALCAEGVGVVLGPVAEGAGAWGMGVFRAASEAQARARADADPAVARGLCTADVLPMLSAMLGAAEST